MDLVNRFNDQFIASRVGSRKGVTCDGQSGGGFGAIFGVNVSNSLMVSYAYSYSLGNQTGVYNNGTHEIILRYNLRQVAKALIDSPRYF